MSVPSVTYLPFHGDLIEFLKLHDDTLTLLWRDGEAYIAVRPVCEVLGVNFSSQRRKLTAPESDSVVAFMTTTGADGKRYEMLCIHVADFMMWLATISPSRVQGTAREALLTTRREIRALIWNHYRETLTGNAQFRSFVMEKEKMDLIARKPARFRVAEGLRLGWSFDRIWKAGSMSRPKLARMVAEMLALGLIDAAPVGTPAPELTEDRQASLFAE